MRKRNVSFILDEIMWALLYTLPLIIILCSLAVTPLADVIEYLQGSTISAIEDTFVFEVFSSIVGEGGLLPMFTGSINVLMLYYATYFVYMWLLHLFIDFLVFIPRLCHKWLNNFYGGEKS